MRINRSDIWYMDFIMQMGAGGLAATADGRDHIACLYVLADTDPDLVHMSVDADAAVVLLDTYPQPEAGSGSGFDHFTISGRGDRGAHLAAEVDSVVVYPPAWAESGGQNRVHRADGIRLGFSGGVGVIVWPDWWVLVVSGFFGRHIAISNGV